MCTARKRFRLLANKAIGRLLIDSRGDLDRFIGPCANRARSAELSHPFFFVAQTCTSLSPLWIWLRSVFQGQTRADVVSVLHFPYRFTKRNTKAKYWLSSIVIFVFFFSTRNNSSAIWRWGGVSFFLIPTLDISNSSNRNSPIHRLPATTTPKKFANSVGQLAKKKSLDSH